MIGLPAGTRIWIAAGVTDLRRGFTGLSGMVQTALKPDTSVLRYRGNFSTFASTRDGTVLSYGYNFWVHSSCTKTSGGVVQFVNDVPGDNQIGSGSAALTWNLQ
jgi:hypothetical protein